MNYALTSVLYLIGGVTLALGVGKIVRTAVTTRRR